MWPFSRKPLDITNLPRVTDDRQQWTVAMATHDGEPIIIRVNNSANRWAEHPDLPIKLGFAVPLNTPVPGGLPDPEENKTLNVVEDSIASEVESKTKGLHALTLTTGMMKEFIFYIPEGVDIKTMHESLQRSITTHAVQCIAEREAKWETFRSFKV